MREADLWVSECDGILSAAVGDDGGSMLVTCHSGASCIAVSFGGVFWDGRRAGCAVGMLSEDHESDVVTTEARCPLRAVGED